MSASVRLDGLRDLIRRMDRVPDDLQARTADVIAATSRGVAAELRSELAQGPTGNLRRRVRVQRHTETRHTVISGAPHAYINEYGTKQRRNRFGANRGVSPARKVVGRVASQARRVMDGALENAFAKALGLLG